MPTLNETRIQYVIDTFWLVYVETGKTEFGYGDRLKGGVNIFNSGTNVFETRNLIPESNWTRREWAGRNIPFPFVNHPEKILEKTDTGVKIHFDLFAGAFFFLSGWQEFVIPERDSYGRFSYSSSFQARNGTLAVPVVNYYFDVLAEAIGLATGEKPQIRSHGGKFLAFLSHDIDICKSGWKGGSKWALQTWKWHIPFLNLAGKLFGKDPWFNFSEILRKEKARGLTSTFYFLCRKGWIGNMPHADFDISDSSIRKVMEEVAEAGGEVAMHGSRGAHEELEKFQADLKLFNRKTAGNRFHFLNFDIRKTPKLLEEAGMDYDATLGFSERPGFRNGICHPFFLYDLQSDRQTRVLEIPLNVMDSTFAETKYLGTSPEKARDFIREVATETKKFKGCISILWHNTHFSPQKFGGWGEVYWEMAEELSAGGARFVTAKEIHQLFASGTKDNG